MELLKALLALITSFFQSKTAKSKEEISLADKTEEAVVKKCVLHKTQKHWLNNKRLTNL